MNVRVLATLEEAQAANSTAQDEFLRVAVARHLNGRLNPVDMLRWYGTARFKPKEATHGEVRRPGSS